MIIRDAARGALTVLLLALCAALALPAVAAAQEEARGGTQRMYYEAKPAVVYIWAVAEAEIRTNLPQDAMWRNVRAANVIPRTMRGVLANTGSGWLISPSGHVVTNAHVVQLYHDRNEPLLRAELLLNALEEEEILDALHRASVQAAREAGQAPPAPPGERDMVELLRSLLDHTSITIERNLYVYTQNWRRYSAEVREYSPPIAPFEGTVSIPGITVQSGRDVAILKVEGRDLPALQIGDSDQMRIGDPVHLAGYPGVIRSMVAGRLNPETEVEATFTRGQVSSLKMDVRGGTVLQFDAAAQPGHSGGPLFNDRGEVIGMATLGGAPGVTFAVPTSVINEFIRSAGIAPEQGLFNRNWAQALDAFYTGMEAARTPERTAEARTQLARATSLFDQSLRILPDLRDALELRRDAITALDGLPDAPAPVGDRNLIPWIIGGVIAVGLLLLAWGLWMRRSQEQEVIVVEEPLEIKPIPAGDGGRSLGRLVVLAGPLQGNRFPLPREGLKIGRDPSSCQIVLSDGTVSREHAVVLASGENSEVVVRNLSGTNPTYVNDRAVQEAALRTGDRIKIGNSVLNYEQDSP